MRENNLERIIKAQESEFKTALAEIKSGHKRSCWMWYIFPQIAGLGRIQAVEDLYVAHTKDAIDSLGAADDAADDGEEASADADTEVTDDTAEDTEAAE